MNVQVGMLTDQEIERIGKASDEGFGSLRSDRGPFPLQDMDVRANIDGLIAHVELCQKFVNVFSEPLEATYIFPLPDRAAVSAFEMEVAGRRIEGVLQERGQARAEYERAIQAGHRAAISEEERPNVFTLRVGNLMPQEKATIRFRMVMPLLFSAGEATFRFPLVVAPRYIPGTPLPGDQVGSGTAPDTDEVPDASRISPPVLLPGFPNPVRLGFEVEINPSGLPLSDLRASLHSVSVTLLDQGRLRIKLNPGERLNRDFILRYRLGDDAVRTSLVLQPDAGNANEGTFTLTLVPPLTMPQAARPRDLVFLLDHSGSMGGWKMVTARRALAGIIDTLTDADCFTVLAFDHSIEWPPGFSQEGVLPATGPNRVRCSEWLRQVEAAGGTEIAKPIDRAVSILSRCSAERDRVLVLVTDGQVGNESQILSMLETRLQGLRVFTIGIDQTVNEGFLNRLAALGGGAGEMVESAARLEEVMENIHRRLGAPVLSGLRIESDGLQLDPDSITPHRLPDLFVGSPVVIAGRYRGSAPGSINLYATNGAGRPWHTSPAAVVSTNPAHAKLWARNRLRDLEDQFDTGLGDREQLEKKILETSLRFGVLCRFTAFVAVDRSEVVNAGGQERQVIQPVDSPAGWDMFLVGGASTPAPAAIANVNARPRGAPSLPLRRMMACSVAFNEDLANLLASASARMPDGSTSHADFTCYRPEFEKLLEETRAAADKSLAERLAALKILAERLKELLDKIDAEMGLQIANLRGLLTSLVELLAKDQPTEAEVQAGWEKAVQELEDFFKDQGWESALPTRQRSFWKIWQRLVGK
jgi:Ca-activated chloride channel family protein